MAIGALIRDLRLARGWSQDNLADALNVALPDATITRSLVSRYESEGRLPTSSRLIEALSQVLCAPESALRAEVKLSRVDRRIFLGLAGASALRPILGTGTADADGHASRSITAADIQAINEITRSIGGLDNRFGGSRVHHTALQYLDSQVKPMIRDGRYSDQVGRGLYQAAARLGHLVAWTAYDMPASGDATNFFGQALDLAIAADDTAFVGEVLAARSHRAIHVKQLADALQLAQASQAVGKRSGVPALFAEACVLEANARALLGDSTMCASSLDRAEKAFDHADASNTPNWLSYLDAGYLAARFAHCLRDVGDLPRARVFAGQATKMSSKLRRTQALNLNLLATTYVESDPERACSLASRVIALSSEIQSGRVTNYLSDLHRRLTEKHPNNVQVREFTEKYREYRGV